VDWKTTGAGPIKMASWKLSENEIFQYRFNQQQNNGSHQPWKK
jgi:hypothetical protein